MDRLSPLLGRARERGGRSGGMRGGLSGVSGVLLIVRAGATSAGARREAPPSALPPVCPLPGRPALKSAQRHSPHSLQRSWAHLPGTFLPLILCRVRPAVTIAHLRTFLRLSPLCDSLSPRPLPAAACTGTAKSTGQTPYMPRPRLRGHASHKAQSSRLVPPGPALAGSRHWQPRRPTVERTESVHAGPVLPG